jgi:hypothetical protein
MPKRRTDAGQDGEEAGDDDGGPERILVVPGVVFTPRVDHDQKGLTEELSEWGLHTAEP